MFQQGNMEHAPDYHYPPKINVPRGLRTIIEGLSRAVVQRQPESVPHFATLYFAELLRFRAGTTNVVNWQSNVNHSQIVG